MKQFYHSLTKGLGFLYHEFMPKKFTPRKPLSILILMPIILIIVILTGIYLMQAPPKKTAQTKSCQYDTDVCLFFDNMQKKTTKYKDAFTATILTTKKDNTTSKVIVKTDGKNNLDMTVYKDDKVQGQSIVFNNTLYVKDILTDTWTQSQAAVDSRLHNFKEKSLAEVSRTGATVSYVFLRSIPCEALTCMKYQRKESKNDPTKTYIFFDTNAHLLREIQITTPDGTTSQTHFSYTPVSITNPMQP